MLAYKKFTTALCGVLAFSSVAVAGDKEDALIQKIVSAYGGDKVTSMNALAIHDRYKILNIGQSASPSLVDIAHNNVSLTIDYKNQRKSLRSWNKGRGGSALNQAIFDGAIGHNLDHLRHTHAENSNQTFDGVGGGFIRSNDITLVKVLLKNRESARHDGEEMYRGRSHEKLTYKMEGSPDLTIYVDKEKGLISKMVRTNPQLGELSYVFSGHQKNDGITYASDLNFYIAGQPNFVTVSRHVEVNPNTTEVFDVPSEYENQGETINVTEMMAEKIADDVYMSGQGLGFSIFVDAGDYFVGSGGYPALPDRLKAVQELVGSDKPLREQIVTHHHSDHLGAMNEIAKLGAKFVTVDQHVQTIKDQLTNPVADDQFIKVNGKQSFANGKVEVYDISTVHSENYLLYYVPSAKIVFSADHFGTNLREGLPAGNLNTVTFRQAIDALGIDVERFVSAHQSRILTMDDLRTVTDNYRDIGCPAGESICAS